ncbi:MAG: NUDIX hydrolase [Chloroflexota bacterium]
MVRITTFSGLKNWLSEQNIDFMAWGQVSAKTPENLWNELEQGEIHLEAHPPLRVSHIVQVIIHQNDKILIEVGQELKNNQWRERNCPPGEKMKPREHFQDAAIRCLYEELGVSQQAVTILKALDEPRSTTRNSPSYPGLQTRYIIYTVEVKVAGLPQSNFCTDEISSNQTDPIRKHYWAWRNAEDVQI